MTSAPDSQYRARLAALNDRFAATVPVTMLRIEQVLAACDSMPVPASELLQGLHELLHGVAGSAATFGFPVLGQQCREIEQRMRLLIADQSQAQHWPPLAEQVRQLLRWAARDPRASVYGDPG